MSHTKLNAYGLFKYRGEISSSLQIPSSPLPNGYYQVKADNVDFGNGKIFNDGDEVYYDGNEWQLWGSTLGVCAELPATSGNIDVDFSAHHAGFKPITLTGSATLKFINAQIGDKVYLNINGGGFGFNLDSTDQDHKIGFVLGASSFSINGDNLIYAECICDDNGLNEPVFKVEIWNEDSSTPPIIPNIYNTDDIITANRTVDLDSKKINFDNGDVQFGAFGQGNKLAPAVYDLGVDALGNLVEKQTQALQSQGTSPSLGTCQESFLGSYFTNDNNNIDYFHIKLPYKVDVNANMYHITVKGYAYAGGVNGRVIDLTFVGYCYAPSNNIINTENLNRFDSSNITMLQYVGSDNHVYLRFKTPRVYYNSFRVDALHVGNGTVLTADDIEIIQSATATF